MASEIIGLRVGSSRLTAARVETNGGISLKEVASSELPSGLVVRGEVQSAHNLAEELKAFFKENKLPAKRVRVEVASNRIGVRTIEITGKLDDAELSDAVTFRAQEDLPIPVMEASLDYEVIDQWTNDEDELVRRVLVAVAYRDLIDDFANAFEIAGIALMGIDLEALALLRALTPPSSAVFDEGHVASATVMVNLGSDHAVAAITDGRTMEYARVIDWGGSAVTDALAEGLEISPEEAESIKCGLSEGDSGLPEGLTPEIAARAREVIDEQVTSFARELVSTLQYYQGQPRSLAISHIVLAGGGSRLSGILSTLERLTGVPVRIGDPTVKLQSFPNDNNWTPGPELAVPIGLGMGQ
jgi:type IV pilus assembly protein PilM